jgi:orotate phosphoribosyltransferase
MTVSTLDVTSILQARGALWLHSGNPEDPHVELTSGKCSNGFVDVLRATHETEICELMAELLVRKLRQNYDGRVDWVVGSDHAAATLSYAVAVQLGVKHDFTEKGPDKTQVWKRFVVAPDEVVLQVEDLITTTGTLREVREGIRGGNPCPVNFAPACLALVHRSETYSFEGAPVLYLVHYDIAVWESSDCPLCAAGSRRIRPKQNWAELTGRR